MSKLTEAGNTKNRRLRGQTFDLLNGIVRDRAKTLLFVRPVEFVDCEQFVLDVTHPNHRMCRCGFAKEDHTEDAIMFFLNASGRKKPHSVIHCDNNSNTDKKTIVRDDSSQDTIRKMRHKAVSDWSKDTIKATAKDKLFTENPLHERDSTVVD